MAQNAQANNRASKTSSATNQHINTMSSTTKSGTDHDDIDERKKSKRSSACRKAATTGSLPPPDNDAATIKNKNKNKNKNNKRPKRSHSNTPTTTTTTTTTKQTIKVCLISIFGDNNDEEEDSSNNNNKKFVDIEVINFDDNDDSMKRKKKLRKALAKLKKQSCRAFGFSITSMMFRLLMYDDHEQIIEINENNITTIKPNDLVFIQSSFASSSSLVSSSIPPPSSMMSSGEADDDHDDENGIDNKENDSSQSTTNSTTEFKPSSKDYNAVDGSKIPVKKRKHQQKRSISQDSRNDKTSASSSPSNHNAVDDSTVVKRFDKKQKISKSQASIDDNESIPSASLPSSSNHNDGEVDSAVSKRKEKKQKISTSKSQNNKKKSSSTTVVTIDLTTEEEGGDDDQNKDNNNNNNAKHSLSRTSPPPAKSSFSHRPSTTTTAAAAAAAAVQHQQVTTSQPASMCSKREDAKQKSQRNPGQKSLSYDSPSAKMHYQQTIQREEKVPSPDTLQQTKHHHSEQQHLASLFGTFLQNDRYENFLQTDDTDRRLPNDLLHGQATTTRRQQQIPPSPATSTAQRIASITSNSKNHQQQVPFGKFQHGTDIYRNKIGPNESNSDGHYSIQELVQPNCISGFCTTFGSGRQEYMNEIFGSTVTNLVVVSPAAYYTQSNDERLDDNNKNKKIKIGNGILVPMEFNTHNRQWHWLYTDVHTGACLHSKLSLFRCHQGLRVVVSGNNLCKHQQERQRDVFWVQDFPIYTTEMLLKKQQQEFKQGYESTDSNGSRVASKSSSSVNTFEKQLRSFVQDIASCSSHVDQQVVDDRINNTIFNNIDFSDHQAELVISFPRQGGYRTNKKIDCGGYRHLANAVANAITKLKRPTFRPSGSSVLYCTSGSMGDLKPNFIKQMHSAMLGITMNVEKHENSKTQWSDVHRNFRCLWPSVDMAMRMDLEGLASALRPMPAEAYQEIHLWSPRSFHKVFHDAIPNPPSTTINYRLPKTGYSSDEEDDDHGNNEMSFYPVTHGKFMWNNSGILYVGSHNFSASAWGVSSGMPKNVELGVVLVSDDKRQHKKWIQRFPCRLVASNAVSPDTYKAYTGLGAIHKEGRNHPLEPPMAIRVGNDDLRKNPVSSLWMAFAQQQEQLLQHYQGQKEHQAEDEEEEDDDEEEE